jgi:8-oxo-dGTP diphosphatase
MMPEAGKWSIPAGYLDYGEDPELTAVREVLEETGLLVETRDLFGVYHNPDAVEQGGASIFILYQAHLIGGQIEAGDDADEVGFFRSDDLPELAFRSMHDVIKRWKSGEIQRVNI